MANGVVSKGASKTMQKSGQPAGKKSDIFARAKRFLRESYIEVRYKAAWPSRSELQKFTTVVIFTVLIAGLYLGILDYLMSMITSKLGFGLHK